jgi:SAM-dependent methyltransferase
MPTRHTPDRFDLYELCVQAPRAMARFLEAVHGREALLLREDFSGGGALCRAWVTPSESQGEPGGARRAMRRRAIAVDIDARPLERLRGVPRIRVVCADVMVCGTRSDIIAALNFPLGYFHERARLVRYLRLSRRRLRPGGVFVGDTYGGASAFRVCTREAEFVAATGERVTYEWEQRRADLLTARVVNAIHFTVRSPNGCVRRLRNAFTYDWRLWSPVELRDAALEAGFRRVEFYDQEAGAIDHLGRLHVRPLTSAEELASDWVVYVVARA